MPSSSPFIKLLIGINCFVLLCASQSTGNEPKVISKEFALILTIEGAIGPAVSDHITRAIEKAPASRAKVIILKMDTPGGLDTSMRKIVQSILASKIPVITYVSPEGARAASAGTYIFFASHVAAMAPATNLGATTPIQIRFAPDFQPQPEKQQPTIDNPAENSPSQDIKPRNTLEQKQINDAVAYIRGLASQHNRNANWAEQTVRQAASLSAEKAVEQNVADFIAQDIRQVLLKAHGRIINVNGKYTMLDTAHLSPRFYDMDWRSNLLAVITNPNLAYILLMIGMYGIIFELSNPGIGIPGIIGAICLLLAFYAFQVLPISYVGLALIAMGIILMVAEAFAPSFGLLGIGGVIAFVIGSIVLMDTDLPGYQIALPLVAAFAFTTILLSMFVINIAVHAFKRKVTTGKESWIGTTAVAIEDFNGQGKARFAGEVWKVQCEEPVQKGEVLRVSAVNGLTLHVTKQESKQ